MTTPFGMYKKSPYRTLFVTTWLVY